MIPYLTLPGIQLGPVTIQAFGVFASLAVLFGLWYAYRVAEREMQAGQTLLRMAPWFLFSGFFGAHVASVVFYYPQALRDGHYWTLLDLTSGLSSYGGLFAGALGAYLFTRRHGLPVLPWLDVLARGFSLAYVFGRAGCTVTHDHPGLPSDFFLAVLYPARDGFPAGPRHDLGWYELLVWIAIFAVFHWLSRRPRPNGFFIGLLIVGYAPVRFGLDFLRVNDLTYLGLTFAQWCCILVLPFGIWLLVKVSLLTWRAD